MDFQASSIQLLPRAPDLDDDDDDDDDLPQRPQTRADCVNGPRPCPWVSCKYHLAIDVSSGGGDRRRSIQRNSGRGRDIYLGRYSELDFVDWADGVAEMVMAMPSTCSLDVAEDGGKTLDEVGQLLGVTRERVRQIEQHALVTLRRRPRPLGQGG